MFSCGGGGGGGYGRGANWGGINFTSAQGGPELCFAGEFEKLCCVKRNFLHPECIFVLFCS